MKKFLCLVLLLVSLAGCGSSGGWNTARLTAAAEHSPQPGITMTITELSETAIQAEFQNTSDTPWYYGEAYTVEVLVEEAWYRLPVDPPHEDIGYVLPSGETAVQRYSLNYYGDLPAGTYRLVVEGVTAEFKIE